MENPSETFDAEDELDLDRPERVAQHIANQGELLSQRDRMAEALVTEICRSVMEETRVMASSQAAERRQNRDKDNSMSADELEQYQLSRAHERLSLISPVLSARYGALLKSHFQFLQEERLQNEFAVIEVQGLSLDKKAAVYKRCFDNFIDASDAVAFATHNKMLLGNVTPKDYWIIMFFIQMSCRRVKGDGLLQLIISGKASYTLRRLNKLIQCVKINDSHFYFLFRNLFRREINTF